MASEYIEDSKGLILFFDEARFGLQPDIARQWSLKGKRPVAPVKTGYKNFYIYAAVDPIEGESFILGYQGLILTWSTFFSRSCMMLSLTGKSCSYGIRPVIIEQKTCKFLPT